MTVEPLDPHGFCLGVRAAIDKAHHALAVSRPLYCLHPIVHNEHVVEELAQHGLRLVANVMDIPHGASVLISAHGASPALYTQLAERALHVVDATCPFVARAHRAVAAFAARHVPIVVIGHKDHVEVQGFVGEAVAHTVAVVASADEVANLPFDEQQPVGVVCQTTLSAEMVDPLLSALKARYPYLEMVPASDVCTATRRRQAAVRDFVLGGGDGVLVLGSTSSSNTARLAECASAAGARFVARAATLEEVRQLDLRDVERLGVTSGASTPESFFVAACQELTGGNVPATQ